MSLALLPRHKRLSANLILPVRIITKARTKSKEKNDGMQKEKKKIMKTFVKTICVGNFYNYCVYKIIDSVGRSYFLAEPITHGATRYAETEAELKAILERDVEPMNQFWAKVR